MPPPRVFDSFLKLCLYTNTKNQSQLSVKDTKVSVKPPPRLQLLQW